MNRSTAGAWEVFLCFLRLGLTAFGGPIAHLGYFRTEFVERRRWLDEHAYADLVALCQFLPGPASSQVGMGLGLLRAGWPGAAAAWAGFTLPSAVALMAFAHFISGPGGLSASGAVHGLKVVAVAVVAQAVWGMAKVLCPDPLRAVLALLAAGLTLVLPTAVGQVGAIVVCGLLGRAFVRVSLPPPAQHASYGVSRRAGVAAAVLFAMLLAGLPLWAALSGSPSWALVDGVYRAGALVFGGGHVVLPWLESTVVAAGAVSTDSFLAGYGAAQAVPGPLFTFAAYLGAVSTVAPLSGWWGGMVFLAVSFTPAFLLLVAALPFWEALRQRPGIQHALAGVNAAVVGILLSALVDPVGSGALRSGADVALALAAFCLLVVARLSPVIVVALAAGAGWALSGVSWLPF